MSENDVTENGRRIKQSGTINFSKMTDGYAVYKIASGEYCFRSDLKKI
jgi:hypothetical protein